MRALLQTCELMLQKPEPFSILL